MSRTTTLPLNFKNTNLFEVFIKGFEDKDLSTCLVANKANLPTGIEQIIDMSDDKKFLFQVKELLSLHQSSRKGNIDYEAMNPTVVKLYEYSLSTYPEGFALLEAYVSKSIPKRLGKEFTVQFNKNANAAGTNTATVDGDPSTCVTEVGATTNTTTTTTTKTQSNSGQEEVLKAIAVLVSIKGHAI